MKLDLRYVGRSEVRDLGSSRLLSFAPNLARDLVAFDAPLAQPLRFREAISALHDVVISDLRYQPRDKTAYVAWKAAEAQRMRKLQAEAYHAAKTKAIAERLADMPPTLPTDFVRARTRYWDLRRDYSNRLLRENQSLWRLLMPCDPIVTVADDVVFFECFSKDESSYGCLTVARDGGFGPGDLAVGTTNVDYSWNLYHAFQSLRSYRETRLKVDPQGFEVATEGRSDYREEKIDLPDGWLQGFFQLQSAMALPMRSVTLTREAVYSLLTHLKRHKPKTSPRALRFELEPGRPPRLVLEPTGETIDAHGVVDQGREPAVIRLWGRKRLLALSRLLPLAERFDVHLLGTGLPSFWTAVMGEMRLTLGLSGWTTNDWTRSSALDLMLAPARPKQEAVDQIAGLLHGRRSATRDELAAASLVDPAECLAALNHLARQGRVIYDLTARRYRWREILPGSAGAPPRVEHPELTGSIAIVQRKTVKFESMQEVPDGGLVLTAKADGAPVSLTLDAEDRIRAGTCNCSYFRRYALKNGPCRHLLATRWMALHDDGAQDAKQSWFERMLRWSGN